MSHSFASFSGLLTAMAAVCWASPRGAAEAKLKAGDPAPELAIGKWVKGDPVQEFEKGTVYLVEFWATWCGPCKAAIPHLTELQRKYKDGGLVVIGVDVWETDVEKVEAFVKETGERMGYTVAVEERTAGADRLQGRMGTEWLMAAGRQGLPSSFIVDREAKIAWIGHPMEAEAPLAAVISGEFGPDWKERLEQKVRRLEAQAREAAAGGRFDEAIRIRDEIAALNPAEADVQKVAKLAILMQKGDKASTNKLAEELVARAAKRKNAGLAARAAATMLTMPGSDQVDASITLEAANLAYELGDKTVNHQRLLARAYAKNRMFDRAIELQEKIVAEVSGPTKDRDAETLREYQSHE